MPTMWSEPVALVVSLTGHSNPLVRVAATECWRVAGDLGDHVADTADLAVLSPDQACYQSRPARLVRCTETGAVVAVEILAENEIVAPGRIGLQDFRSAETWSFSVGIASEKGNEPVTQVGRDRVERQVSP